MLTKIRAECTGDMLNTVKIAELVTELYCYMLHAVTSNNYTLCTITCN